MFLQLKTWIFWLGFIMSSNEDMGNSGASPACFSAFTGEMNAVLEETLEIQVCPH